MVIKVWEKLLILLAHFLISLFASSNSLYSNDNSPLCIGALFWDKAISENMINLSTQDLQKIMEFYITEYVWVFFIHESTCETWAWNVWQFLQMTIEIFQIQDFTSSIHVKSSFLFVCRPWTSRKSLMHWRECYIRSSLGDRTLAKLSQTANTLVS